MAKKKSSEFEQFSEEYSRLFGYESFFEQHPKGKGDVEELQAFWINEMRKEGANDEDIKDAVPELKRRYMQGDREVFLRPGLEHYSEAVNVFKEYGKGNLEGIINSTDDSILREKVLPYVVENYKTGDEKYKKLGELLEDINLIEKKLTRIQDPKTRDSVLNELVEKRKQHYAETYKDNERLRDIFMDLVSKEVEVHRLQENYEKKKGELNEALDKNIKGYINSVGLSGDDLIKIYARIFKEAYQEAVRKES